MKNYFYLLAVLAICHTTVQAQTGIFDINQDLGNPKLKGAASYNAATQEYQLSSAGANIWGNRDEFRYLATRVKGDFLITANFEFVSTGGDAHRKLGWMVREGLEDDAVHLSATYHGDGLTGAQWRPLRGAYMRLPHEMLTFPKKKAQIIQLERRGKVYTMRVANPGEPLQSYGTVTMNDIGENPYVGLFLCSHNADKIEQARIWNVRIDRFMPANFNFNNAAKIGGRLEIIDISSLKRKVVYESQDRFEAPNFLPDGKTLIYNSGGFIYKLPVAGGSPEKLNTGDVQRNNNDHVVSHNGKLLGISSFRRGMFAGGSTIYVLPIEGGQPKLVTHKTPSYLHGWAANNKEVYYVARRDTTAGGLYHIFKANIDTGAETQLTFSTFGRVDGPEGTPDGKWIYYNGSETGTMQLYRMKPDGSGKEQLTFGNKNLWFPHLSPDGRWICYIAYEDDIDPTDHPGCQKVSLQIMPANGGFPQTIAYLYGGQGTINTPSWSPDSKQVAFVSYSGMEPGQ